MARPNQSGNKFAGLVADCLRRTGLSYVPESPLPTEDDMGVRPKADFLVKGHGRFEDWYIECRWQAVEGSVEHKVYALLHRIKAGCYDHPVVAIFDGSKNEKARTFLAKHVGKKLKEVLTLSEFVEWVEQFRGDVRKTKLTAFDSRQGRLF